MDVLAADALVSLLGRGLHDPHLNHAAVPHPHPHPHPHTHFTKFLDHAAAHVAHLAREQRVTHHLLVSWLVLQLAGQITLPILIGTLLFHKRITRRNPTVINLCIVWTLGTIPSELLFYAGKHVGPRPSPILCLFQASTVNAVAPMAAVAYLAVVIHACTVIHEWLHRDKVEPYVFDLRMVLLLASPYLTFLAFALFVAILGFRNPKDVKRATFFCTVKNHNLSRLVLGFSVMVVFMTLAFQLWITYVVFQNWRTRRKGNITPRDMSAVDIQLLARMIAFTVFEVVLVVSFIANGINPDLKGARVLLATPPFAVFLIFSSSPDILRAWFSCCCARAFKRPPEQEDAPPPKSQMDGLERGDGGSGSQTVTSGAPDTFRAWLSSRCARAFRRRPGQEGTPRPEAQRGDGPSRDREAPDLDLEKELPELPPQAAYPAGSRWSAATSAASGRGRHSVRAAPLRLVPVPVPVPVPDADRTRYPIRMLRPTALRTKRNQF